jgi:hypothetical protein
MYTVKPTQSHNIKIWINNKGKGSQNKPDISFDEEGTDQCCGPGAEAVYILKPTPSPNTNLWVHNKGEGSQNKPRISFDEDGTDQ